MIIATRRLVLQQGSDERSVLVNLHAPVEGDGFWSCQFEIGWPEGAKTDETRGFDGAQALHLAMQKIAVHLYASDHHTSGNLYWFEPGQGYGFPMPKIGRDQRVGEDKLAQV